MAKFESSKTAGSCLQVERNDQVPTNIPAGFTSLVREHQPVFTKDWFSENIAEWQRIFSGLSGQPNLNFLEIGVLEGRATVWLLSSVLTDPTSRLTCIDTFEGSVEHQVGMSHEISQLDDMYDRFMHNISPYVDKVRVQKGSSQILLREQKLDSFDFVYIDGSHRAPDVLEDAVLSFRLLKKEGIMIFDDYEWKTFAGTLNNPRAGMDAFLDLFVEQYELISKGYQVAIRKKQFSSPSH